jgi:hypothetical protein
METTVARRSELSMKRTVKIVVGFAECALVLMAAGLAFAESFGDGNDVTGPAADKARAAAIQAVPGGTAGTVEQEAGEGPAVVYGVAFTKTRISTCLASCRPGGGRPYRKSRSSCVGDAWWLPWMVSCSHLLVNPLRRRRHRDDAGAVVVESPSRQYLSLAYALHPVQPGANGGNTIRVKKPSNHSAQHVFGVA